MQRFSSQFARTVIGLLLVLSLVQSAGGAVIHLRNGDRLTGMIQSVDGDSIVISTPWRETLRIPVGEVVDLEKAAGVRVPAPATPPPAVTGPPVAATPAVGGGKGASPAGVTPVEARKPSPWKGSLRVGTDLLFSEKNRYLYTGRVKLSHTTKHLQTSIDYLATYERTGGEVSANRMDGSSKTDFELPGQWYVYNLGRAGYDEIRKVDLRYELGPGMGYHLVKGPALSLNAEVGANYKAETRTDGSETEMLVGRLANGLQWRASPRLTLEESLEFLPDLDDWGTYRIRFEGGLEYQLLEHVALSLTVINQYESAPARSVQENDLQVRSAVGLTF